MLTPNLSTGRFENRMVEEPTQTAERRWWVIAYRRLLPNRFYASGTNPAYVRDLCEGCVYAGIGHDVGDRARAYARARNAAWRADVRFQEDP